MLDGCGQNLYRQNIARARERELLSALPTEGGLNDSADQPADSQQGLAPARAAVCARARHRDHAQLCAPDDRIASSSARAEGSAGPTSFLFHSDQAAIFVQWTRTDDAESGSLSAAQMTQPQPDPRPTYVSTAPPTGQVGQQTGAFTGTVQGDSVRLIIGSGASSHRVNGRLDGDTLELTVPDGQRAIPTRRTTTNHDDHTKAVEQIREHERRRTAPPRQLTFESRQTTRPPSRVSQPPSKDVESQERRRSVSLRHADVKERVRPSADKPMSRRCTADIRNAEAETDEPVSKALLGVAAIRLGVLAAAHRQSRRRPLKSHRHLAPQARRRQLRVGPREDVHQAERAMARVPMLPLESHRACLRER